MRNNKLLVLSLMAILLTCGCDNGNSASNSSNSGEKPTNVENSSNKESSTTNVEQSSNSSSSVENSSSEDIYDDEVLYVSADANDFYAKGTKEDPMLIQWAIRYSKPGSTIYLLDGEYKWGSTVMFDETTEYYPATNEAERKTLRPLNKGKVKINFSQMAWNSSNRGIQVNTNYWTVRDLEVLISTLVKEQVEKKQNICIISVKIVICTTTRMK